MKDNYFGKRLLNFEIMIKAPATFVMSTDQSATATTNTKPNDLEVRTCSDVYFPKLCCCLPLPTSLYLISYIYLLSGLVELMGYFTIIENFNINVDDAHMILFGACCSFVICVTVGISAVTLNRTAICFSICFCLSYLILCVGVLSTIFYKYDKHDLLKYYVYNQEVWESKFKFVESGFNTVFAVAVLCYYRVILLLVTIYVMFAFAWRLKYRPITLELFEAAW